MKSILFYGDSNTYGFDPFNFYTGRYPGQERWVQQLREALAGEWFVCDDGMNGRCIPQTDFEVKNLCRSIRRAQEDCAGDRSGEKPLDILAIMLGSNDCMQMGRPDTEAVAQKMGRLIRRLREEEPDGFVRLLLMAPPDMDFTGDPWFERAGITVVSLSEPYRRVAEETGSLFVDTAAWGLPMTHDRVHLSGEGHRIMAERLKEVLHEL